MSSHFKRFMLFKRYHAWSILGVVLGTAWFLKNLFLPLQYRGRACCDAIEYVKMAEETPSLLKMFVYSGGRTFGYPFYLKLHQVFYSIFFSDREWITWSFYTTLILNFWACFSLFRTCAKNIKIPLHPIYLFLLLAHPGLTSYAALTLTDSITTALFTFAISKLIQGFATKDVSTKRKEYLYAGLLLGCCTVIRPLLNPVSLGVLFSIGVIEVVRNKPIQWSSKRMKALLAAAVVPAAFGLAVIVGLGVRNCWIKYKTVCTSDPGFMQMVVPPSLNMGVNSPRYYTSFQPSLRGVAPSDPFMGRHFGGCPIVTIRDLFICYTHDPVALPVFMAKKVIGLFDNFYLNAYAFDLTLQWIRILNRTFGMIGFLGFLSALYCLVFWKKYRDQGVLILAAAICIHVFVCIQFHIESRYGFPIVPCAFLTLGFVLRTIQIKWNQPVLWIFAIGSILFWTQTLIWDGIPT